MSTESPVLPLSTRGVLYEVLQERHRQNEKWGEQNHPDFNEAELTDYAKMVAGHEADSARAECQRFADLGQCSFNLILREEVMEAAAERTDPQALRTELVQVAAVAVQWVEVLDRRAGVIPVVTDPALLMLSAVREHALKVARMDLTVMGFISADHRKLLTLLGIPHTYKELPECP